MFDKLVEVLNSRAKSSQKKLLNVAFYEPRLLASFQSAVNEPAHCKSVTVTIYQREYHTKTN